MNVLDKRERPILFSAPMVLALLDGRKTQTRRVVKPQPEAFYSGHSEHGPFERFWVKGVPWSVDDFEAECCPYGQPGDRLWVKETWRPQVAHSCAMDACDCGDVNITYRADGHVEHFRDGTMPDDWTLPKAAATGNVSPLFMPHWASRITLEITDVRVQRLNEIGRADAEAEGCTGGNGSIPGYHYSATPHEHFRDVWNAINGPTAWDANPWVWALSFQPVSSNG